VASHLSPIPTAPRKAPTPTRSRRFVVACILAVGLSVAAAIYLAAPPSDDDEAYEAHEVQHSKKVLREVEGIGGKAAVFTTDLNDWVASLWHGQTLGYTVAVVTAIVAGAYWLWPRESDDDEG